MRHECGVLIVLGLVMAGVAWAAPGDTLWTKTCGGIGQDKAASVCCAADGGFAIAGTTTSFGAGGADFWLVRTDAAGETLWTRTYGGPGEDECHDMVATGDGGFALAGHTTSFGTVGWFDAYLVKVDSLGQVEWDEHYHSSQLIRYTYALIQTADGGYVICGCEDSVQGIISRLVFMAKVNAAGTLVWMESYRPGSSLLATGLDVIRTSDNGFAAGGTALMASYDACLVKADSSGNESWINWFGGPSSNDQCLGLLQTPDHGYLLAGLTTLSGQGGQDACVLKISPSGNSVEWMRTFGGPNDDVAADPCPAAAGGYFIVGTTGSFGAGGDDLYAVRTDDSGDTLWTAAYGGPLADSGVSAAQTADGGFVIAGWTESWGAGSSDFYLVKIAGDPLAPMALRMHLLHPTTARLSWLPVVGATEYEIYRSATAFFTTVGTPWATVPAPATQLDVTEGVGDPAVDYSYRGRSRNATSVSVESETVGERDFVVPCP
ncbi:hypothetical protein JXA88_15800 [Candidatus Fermentibacteria bacterium]|nr:hypothetical protein [Candidatus Fermentibacteria bacterium]